MNNEYAKLLRKKEWKEKRTFILDLNGGKCARCGRTTNLHAYFCKGALSDRAKCYTRTIEYQIEE